MSNYKTLVITAILTAASNGAVASVISTFDVDDEGWQASGDSTSTAPTWVDGGWIEADDTVSGGTWYFDAPDKYLGDQSGSFGQTLSFDLMQEGSGSQFSNRDLILDGGGLQLTLDFDSNPLPLGEWVSYSIILDDTANWVVGGIAATNAQIQTVLGSLNRLRIRGEYISGSDTGSLDNVVLAAVPVPAAVWLFGSALLGLGAIKRKRA